LTLDDVPVGVPHDQLTATRAFNAARNTYELYANAHAINDHFDLSEQDARAAREDPSLRRVERCFRDLQSWCRAERVPGLTASLLDQLGTLYLRQGRHEDARKCFDDASQLFDALPNTTRSMIKAKSDFHYRCAVLEFREGNIDAALDRLQRSALETEGSGARSDAALVQRAIDRCRRRRDS
jgi:tetratricopeptide (TPR) repeat protein